MYDLPENIDLESALNESFKNFEDRNHDKSFSS